MILQTLLLIALTQTPRPPASEAEYDQCMRLQEFLVHSGNDKDEDETEGVRLKLNDGTMVWCGPVWHGAGKPAVPMIESGI